MANTDNLAQFHLPHGGDPDQSLTAQSIRSCLRFLEEQAERVGMRMTAHLISTAALAALDESIPAARRVVN